MSAVARAVATGVHGLEGTVAVDMTAHSALYDRLAVLDHMHARYYEYLARRGAASAAREGPALSGGGNDNGNGNGSGSGSDGAP
jgi:hypothetical protein